MKKTLLIALLGAAFTLATPSLSFADNGYKFTSGAAERNHQYKHKHGTRHHHKKTNQKFVAKPPKKTKVVKHTKRIVKNTHAHNKNKLDYRNSQYTNKRRNQHNNNSSFSISWNVGDSVVTYGNDSFKHGYQKRNNGKILYARINKQATLIQRGIRNGQLVNREVSTLRHEQRTIKQTLSHYKRDGHLNRYERSKMNHLLDVANNNIHQKSNNRRTRYAQNHDHKHYQYDNHNSNYKNHFVQF